MLKSLQEILAVATVVRGDVVIGHVDRVEINSEGIYIVLEDMDEDTGDDGPGNVITLEQLGDVIVRMKDAVA